MKNIIKTSEHCFVAGMTGSGKTFLAEVYLAGFDNVIALDTKGMLRWEQAGNVPIYERLEDLISEHTGNGKAIYRPRWEEMTPEFYNSFFEWIYKRKNTIAWVDEVMSICPNATSIPDFYKAILTRGRERNTAVWSCTQRPKTIPLVILSECTHFFVFDLNLETDRRRIYEIIEQDEVLIKPSSEGGKHSFWYYNVMMDNPQLAKLK